MKKNLSEAAVWYQKAAEGGVPGAQLNLGVAYLNGEGVAKEEIYLANLLWQQIILLKL